MLSASSTDRFLSDVALQVRGLSVDAWGESRAVEMVGHNGALVALLAKLARVAPHDEPVLIVGESGSGKEALAQALYLLGPRRGRPWMWVGAAVAAGALLAVAAMLIGQARIGPSAGGPFTPWINPEPTMPGAPPARPVPASPSASMTSTPPDSKVTAPAPAPEMISTP